MGKLWPARWFWLVPGVAALACGCTSEDNEHLARIGAKISTKVQAFSGDADGKLTSGWKAIRGEMDETSVDGRVSSRLRWDKNLAGTSIQVSAKEGVVELKGTVKNLDQRRRAVELAETTSGVEKVTDSLESQENN